MKKECINCGDYMKRIDLLDYVCVCCGARCTDYNKKPSNNKTTRVKCQKHYV